MMDKNPGRSCRLQIMVSCSVARVVATVNKEPGLTNKAKTNDNFKSNNFTDNFLTKTSSI